MSVRVIAVVFKQSQATLGARLVLLVLADSAHDDGVTWISQERIAEKTKLSTSSVRRVISELEAAGEVQVRKVQRGRRRINVYWVSLPGVGAPRYDDYPFEIDEQFEADQNEHTDDDRSSWASTTAHPERSRALVPLIGLNRKGNRKKDLPTDVGANDIVAHYVEATTALGGTAPSRVKGQVAKLVGELLKEGIKPAAVTAGVDLMVERRLHPSTLPSCVNEASMPRRAPARGRSDGRMTAEEIMARAVQHAKEGR